MPITMCGTGVRAVIRKLGGKSETRRFLEKLGFTPGEQVTVVSENSSGLILTVKGARVALDRSLAQRIMV